jgi:hypothetical protein
VPRFGKSVIGAMLAGQLENTTARLSSVNFFNGVKHRHSLALVGSSGWQSLALFLANRRSNF